MMQVPCQHTSSSHHRRWMKGNYFSLCVVNALANVSVQSVLSMGWLPSSGSNVGSNVNTMMGTNVFCRLTQGALRYDSDQ